MAAKTTQKAAEVKTIATLEAELAKLQLEHLESRRSHKQGELVNPRVLNTQRKDIARAHTAITIAQKADLLTKKEEK